MCLSSMMQAGAESAAAGAPDAGAALVRSYSTCVACCHLLQTANAYVGTVVRLSPAALHLPSPYICCLLPAAIVLHCSLLLVGCLTISYLLVQVRGQGHTAVWALAPRQPGARAAVPAAVHAARRRTPLCSRRRAPPRVAGRPHAGECCKQALYFLWRSHPLFRQATVNAVCWPLQCFVQSSACRVGR